MKKENKGSLFAEGKRREAFTRMQGADFCVFCGDIVPEGIMICPRCESELEKPRCSICDRILEDGQIICPFCEEKLLKSSAQSDD